MSLRAALSVPLATLLLAPALALAADGYSLDPVHTRVLFAVSHAGFSQAMGTVSGSSGRLWFDPEDWRVAKLAVRVPLARLDMGDAKWTKAVGARNLLDVGKFPDATFVSTRIEPKDAQHGRVCGTLTIRDVSHDACMDVTFNQLKHHPLPPFRRTAGFSATTTISRKDFGITAWPGVIGDTVTLRIEAEALHDGGVTVDTAGQLPPAGAAPTPPPDEPASPDQNPTSTTPSDLPSPP
jgi:polyisoprenoid-binding protein YceI